MSLYIACALGICGIQVNSRQQTIVVSHYIIRVYRDTNRIFFLPVAICFYHVTHKALQRSTIHLLNLLFSYMVSIHYQFCTSSPVSLTNCAKMLLFPIILSPCIPLSNEKGNATMLDNLEKHFDKFNKVIVTSE